MKLIVGLGNPGEKYKNTRHNIGFMFMEKYIEKNKCDSVKGKFQGEYTTFTFNGEKIILFKPLTYMNLSGIAIKEIIDFYHIENKDILVVYDDKDIPFASLRLRVKGNPGSHNGMKNISQHIGNDFARIRVGIGSPQSSADMVDFVLSKFNKNELSELNESLENVCKAVDLFLDDKFDMAMNKYNGSSKVVEKKEVNETNN